MATQELSQWVVDDNLARSKIHNTRNTMTYVPGQPGYVGSDDLDLGTPQHETLEITPLVESRSVIFPENKRFVEPETPVPESKNGRNSSSSGDTHDFQTPQLPPNPFGNPIGNPFGPVHERDEGRMALSQVFKATQAPSSPNLPRNLPSSQRPSPMLLRKAAPHITSGALADDLVMIEDISPSSPHDSIVSNNSASSQKRALKEDGSSLIADDPQGTSGAGDNTSPRAPKRQRTSEAAIRPQFETPGKRGTKSPVKNRENKVQHVVNQRAASKAIVIEDDINSSEDETEHEDELDGNQSDGIEDNSDGNKENMIVRQDPMPAPGSHIKRASRRLQDQTIPLSSSPAPVQQILHTPGEKRTLLQPPFLDQRENKTPGHTNLNEQISIADSQSSQKVRSRLEGNEERPQIGSSNDSRKVIPQSQALKPPSSLRITSEVKNIPSQQTASPPESTTSDDVHDAPVEKSDTNQHSKAVIQNKPVSPRSSPPIVRRQHRSSTGTAANVRIEERHQDSSETIVNVPDNAQQHSSQIDDSDVNVRTTRSSSAVPETTYVARHSAGYSTSFPTRLYDPFAAAEKIDFSFMGHSQVATENSLEDPRLATSFGSRRVESAVKSPLRRTPRRPKTFSAIALDVNTQEPDSLELDAIFTTDDQEIRDVLARMPGSGSSPLDPVRRKRKRKAPVLLDELRSDDLESQSRETTPVPAKAFHDAISVPLVVDTKRQQQTENRNVAVNEEVGHPETKEKPAFDEPIAFMEHAVPTEQYGRKAKRRMVTQTKANVAKPAQKVASTAPASNGSRKISTSVDNSKKTTKSKPQPKAKVDLRPSTAVASSRSSRTKVNGLSAGTQTPCSAPPNSSAPLTDAVVPTRVFAEFRGSPPGFFAATCLNCWNGEAELKYSIRFDDGTIDQLGQALVKRLELQIGDQVKIDRKQYKSGTFVVTGFGHRLDEALLENETFPMTDIYGHATVHVRIEVSGKKKSVDAENLEIPITEVFFTRGMRSAFRDRDYSHPSVQPKPLATPTDSRLPSNAASPSTRTRLTNRLGLAESKLAEGINKAISTNQPAAPVDGLFKDIVLIFTNNPSITQSTSDAIEREGGTILKGQQDIEDMFDTPKTHIPSKEQEGEINHEAPTSLSESTGPASISIRHTYKETRLAVLVADNVCRTTKYYQALALGIPCISSRWVTDCLQGCKLKSWRQYLLAAGESEILGTTLSQQLNFTHNEIDLCYIPLSTLIARRVQWLQKASILLVGNGAEDCDKRLAAYTFFAWILGAAKVAAVADGKEAERYLANKEHQFDWVCIDNEKAKGVSKGDRKSKRASETNVTNLARIHMENVKVIDTRHVTQSLILGSLVDVKDQ